MRVAAAAMGTGIALAALSCGHASDTTCVPSQVVACACSDGTSGMQVCTADRTYDPCLCTGVACTPDLTPFDDPTGARQVALAAEHAPTEDEITTAAAALVILVVGELTGELPAEAFTTDLFSRTAAIAAQYPSLRASCSPIQRQSASLWPGPFLVTKSIDSETDFSRQSCEADCNPELSLWLEEPAKEAAKQMIEKLTGAALSAFSARTLFGYYNRIVQRERMISATAKLGAQAAVELGDAARQGIQPDQDLLVSGVGSSLAALEAWAVATGATVAGVAVAVVASAVGVALAVGYSWYKTNDLANRCVQYRIAHCPGWTDFFQYDANSSQFCPGVSQGTATACGTATGNGNPACPAGQVKCVSTDSCAPAAQGCGPMVLRVPCFVRQIYCPLEGMCVEDSPDGCNAAPPAPDAGASPAECAPCPNPSDFSCGPTGGCACVPASLVCSTGPEQCSNGADQDPTMCSMPMSCCVATDGCPGETGSNCGSGCCCCPGGQACCADKSGCCASP